MAPRVRNSAVVLNLIPREESNLSAASSSPTTPELTRSSISTFGGRRSFRMLAWYRIPGRNSFTRASRSGKDGGFAGRRSVARRATFLPIVSPPSGAYMAKKGWPRREQYACREECAGNKLKYLRNSQQQNTGRGNADVKYLSGGRPPDN